MLDSTALVQSFATDLSWYHPSHHRTTLCLMLQNHRLLHREPAQNLADNLLRDFEERWWSICRKVC